MFRALRVGGGGAGGGVGSWSSSGLKFRALEAGSWRVVVRWCGLVSIACGDDLRGSVVCRAFAELAVRQGPRAVRLRVADAHCTAPTRISAANYTTLQRCRTAAVPLQCLCCHAACTLRISTTTSCVTPGVPPFRCCPRPQFTQKKADAEVRWAVLNVADMLRRHAALHDQLAAAMRRGASVGACVQLIEERLAAFGDV